MINIIRIIDKFIFKHLNAKKILFRKYFKTSDLKSIHITISIFHFIANGKGMITRRKSLIKSVIFMQ